MRVLFVTTSQYVPQRRGGMQSSAHELCLRLRDRGHQVAVLSGFFSKGALKWRCGIQRKLLRRTFSLDRAPGYRVWRSWFPWKDLAEVAGREKPDVIVVMAAQAVRMALAARRTGIPILMQLQDVEFDSLGGNFQDLGSDVPCVANSGYVANKYRSSYGVDPTVIYPFIDIEQYRTGTTRRNVTFINPFPCKGIDIALGVARRCPEIPFAFVEGWPMSDANRQRLMERISPLSNVRLLRPQRDMRRIYGECKILLVPSVWEEGYGRVVTEAQASGIPVVASNRGGLPESVGSGGMVIDLARPVEDWAAAIRKVWSDRDYYARLSKAAVAYAERPDNRLSHKLELWQEALRNASGGFAARGGATKISAFSPEPRCGRS